MSAAGIDLKALLLATAVNPDGFTDGYLRIPPIDPENTGTYVSNDPTVAWKAHEWFVEIDLDFFAADTEDTRKLAATLEAAALQAEVLNSDVAFGLLVEGAPQPVVGFRIAGVLNLNEVPHYVYLMAVA